MFRNWRTPFRLCNKVRVYNATWGASVSICAQMRTYSHHKHSPCVFICPFVQTYCVCLCNSAVECVKSSLIISSTLIGSFEPQTTTPLRRLNYKKNVRLFKTLSLKTGVKRIKKQRNKNTNIATRRERTPRPLCTTNYTTSLWRHNTANLAYGGIYTDCVSIILSSLIMT